MKNQQKEWCNDNQPCGPGLICIAGVCKPDPTIPPTVPDPIGPDEKK